MKTLFLTAGPEWWASSRMRAFWPAKYMDGAEVMVLPESGASLPDEYYDHVIFQKTYDAGIAANYWARGARCWLDVCDPSWWFQPQEVHAILPELAGVVASSEALRADFAEWCNDAVPSYTIPDRLELSHFPLQRQHAEVSPLRLIWFGIAANRVALIGATVTLERLAANGIKFELTIMDEQPNRRMEIESNSFPIYHTRWTLEQENAVIAAHDIALLPPYPGPWGRVKSNNKDLTAWACGLPVANGHDYYHLANLCEYAGLRQTAAVAGRVKVEIEYTADTSAREWEAILCAS